MNTLLKKEKQELEDMMKKTMQAFEEEKKTIYIYKNSNSQRRNNKFASRANYSTNKEEYSIVPCKFNVTFGATKTTI
jgi:hypothetical protein